MTHRIGAAALLVSSFVVLGLPSADAMPAPPKAAGQVPAASETAELISARLRNPTGTSGVGAKLSSKSALAGFVGAEAAHLSRPVVLSLARPMVGSTRYTLWDPERTIPESGEALFYNRSDVDGAYAGAIMITLDVMAGATYVVECVAASSDWDIQTYQPGAEQYEQTAVTYTAATERPRAIVASEVSTTAKILFMPRMPSGETRAVGRCQVSRLQPAK